MIASAALTPVSFAMSVGIGKGGNATNEHFLVTLLDSSHNVIATENITLTDGTTLLVDANHWGANVTNYGVATEMNNGTTGTFGAFSEVTVTNIASAAGDDPKVNLTSVVFNEQTIIGSTTLDFTPTITDGDADSATGSLVVSLQGTPSAGGSYTMAGTGNEVLLSGPVSDIFNLSGNNNVLEYKHPTDGGTLGDTANGFNNLSPTNDSITVSASGFGGQLTAGEIFNTTQVQTAGNATFTDPAERFLFDTANHTLYYSADGTTGNEHALAIMNLVAAINPTNIHVVA
jgi:large repetitive protein